MHKSVYYDLFYEDGLYNIYCYHVVHINGMICFEPSLIRSFRSYKDAINYLNLLI